MNRYLREITGRDFTAKDFRTWAGTVLAANALQRRPRATSQAQARRHAKAAVETVAERLGNTPAICRKSYVHPAVIDAYLDGTLAEALAPHPGSDPESARLRSDERAVLAFLRDRLAADTAAPALRTA